MSPAIGLAWRFAALGGIALGLALAPLHPVRPAPAPLLLALAVGTALLRSRDRRASPWPVLVAFVSVLAGLALGTCRLEAIDGRALVAGDEEAVVARGTVVTTPREVNGATRFALSLPEGRIVVDAARADGVDEGRVVAVNGTVREPAPWEADAIARAGAARILVADEARATGAVRGGLRGALDGIRRRAEDALERGTPAPSAALLRGFVLGQDDRIPDPVRDDFRRSGLAHVLAVSGQNVMLLLLLATPLLALAGIGLRSRFVVLAAVIAVYVPVAGAGASIQRAGVMGAAGLIAALASRPRARWYALLLAAAVTLALDPRATGDVGWQLSFAAVAGLLVVAAPLARLLEGVAPGRARRLFAEGMAMTLAATLATAPLAAHHFGTVSLTAVPANLLALPAIAPAMWLGMLAGAVGQVPGAPVEPLTALGGLCAAFIAWVAHALGGERAQLEIPEPGLVTALCLAACLLGAARLGCLALERRGGLGLRRGCRRQLGLAGAVALTAGLAAVAVIALPRPTPPPSSALVMRVLDVGQGDAILLEPRDAAPILVDAGPPDGGVAARLAELGIERLGAVAITHDQLDHAGGLAELLGAVEVGRLIVAPGALPELCERSPCPPRHRVERGDALRAGRLRLEVLWPPAGAPAPGADPNARSLVLHARLGKFDALLAGDAEAEAAPVDPGPVEVLKVAHHGSADSSLPALLVRSVPELAVVSVGDGNAYGHPAPETLAALAEAGVPVLRTDEHGEAVISVGNDGWAVG